MRRRPHSPRSFLLTLLSTTLLVFGACSEHVLQTATEGPSLATGGSGLGGASGLSCDEPSSGALPPSDREAPRDEPWLYEGGSYGVSQGPGIAVAARDAFRLYVNGHLLHESSGARTPVFIPTSFPPGDNVIALTVAADSGTPALLAQVDELEHTLVSDDSWKYQVDPTGDWRLPGFDDSAFETALELADYGDVPGCDPTSDFPSNSEARWIGPPLGTEGFVGFRKEFRIAPEGFGQDARGGAGETPRVVTAYGELETLLSSDDAKLLLIPEGTYDFRRTGDEIREQDVCPSVCPNDAAKTRYQVLVGEETCPTDLITIPRDDRILRIGSNTTLLGLGRGAALRGVTLDFQDKEHIIVRNVALFDINPEMVEAGDAFSLTAPQHVWIDHGTTQWISDGFTDLRTGTSNVTLSYMRYDGRTDFECDGSHLRSSMIDGSEATIHHSRFDHVRQNAPAAFGSGSRVHLYNNSYSNVGGWTIAAACQAVVLVEGSTFENVEAVGLISDCGEGTELGYLDFPAGSNLYRDGAPVFLGGDGSEPQQSGFTPPYEYELELPSDAWPEVVTRAGTGGPWALPLRLD